MRDVAKPMHDPLANGTVVPPARSRFEGVGAAFAELRGRRLKTFLICLFVWTFVNLEQSLFGYAVPALIDAFGVTVQDIGLVLSLGFTCAIFGSIIAGLLTDRYGRRVTLVGCFSVSSFFYAMQGLAPGIFTLAASRSLGAGISAGLSPISNSYVAEVVPSRIRALMVGFLQIGFPLGWFLASILVVPLLTTFGWRAIFIASLAGPPLGWLIYRAIDETDRFRAVKAAQANRRSWKQQIGALAAPDTRRRTLLCIMAFFTKGGAYAGLAFFLPTFLHEVRGYDAATSARIIGCSYGIGILGYISASIVGEFFLSRKATIVLWCWLGVIALIGFIWLPTTPAQDIAACGIMAIFSFGTSAILTTFVLEQFPTRLRATGAACASASISLGFALLPVVVTYFVGRLGWQVAITACVAPLLFLSGLAVLAMRPAQSGAEMVDL